MAATDLGARQVERILLKIEHSLPVWHARRVGRLVRPYRLGTPAFPVWDGRGAALVGGRWNPVGVAVIYVAGSLALATLERLVQRRNLGVR